MLICVFMYFLTLIDYFYYKSGSFSVHYTRKFSFFVHVNQKVLKTLANGIENHIMLGS